MRIIRKVINVVVIVILSLFIYSTIVKAEATLEVTADTLNLRKEASTDSDILTLLSKGDECELIEEVGDWYKVKYNTYTGYVTKEYVKNNEENDNTVNADEVDSSTSNNTENNNTIDQNADIEVDEITGKISKKTDVKILPLIYSSKIESLNKDAVVTIITELNGWAYIRTDTFEGWIRSNVITDKKTASNDTNNDANEQSNEKQDNETSNNTKENDTTELESDTYTQKTMYTNELYVNLRKKPSTSSDVIMVVDLNTKLTVIGESGDWYEVETSLGNAYVSKELLSEEKTSTTSRSGEIRTYVDNTDSTTLATSNVSSTSKTTSTTNSSSTSTSTGTASTSEKGEQVVEYAKQFLGVPYVYGGASKSGFDCSGFTMYVYKKFGISMPHGAIAQSKLGNAVNANKNSASSLKQNLQPGDLVFFLEYETMDEIGHCGIYIGDGNFIHASSGSGYCVKINSLLPGEYYNTRYCAARRLI